MLAVSSGFDLYRIFLGDKPPIFLLEVAFRTVVVFGYTLVLLRWMGKRGMGNLTPFEFAIIVALGSAVGDPMFYDDVPLLHTMLVITLVVGLQRGMAWLSERNRWVEKALSSSAQPVVREGVILVAQLEAESLTRDELFEELRLKGVVQLGEVQAAYLEPSGNLSVLRSSMPRPGLSVDHDLQPQDDASREQASGELCCAYCGWLRTVQSDRCVACGRQIWMPVTQPSSTLAASEE